MSEKHSSQTIPATPLRFFLHVSRPFVWWIVLSVLFVVLAASAGVGLRVLMEKVVDAVSTQNFEMVALWLLLYPILYFVISILWRISGVSARQWLLGVPKRSTDTLIAYLNGHSHSYFNDRFAGALSNKISNAVDSSAGLTFQLL